MTVLIIYSTIEGQTGKIANFVADRVRDAGEEVRLLDADETEEAEFADVDKAVLAAPVHERRHPRAFEAFLTAHAKDLQARPTLLLSVSLNAAFPEGMEEALDYVTEMTMRTRLEPTATVLVPGAIRGGARSIIAPSLPGMNRRNGAASLAPASDVLPTKRIR